MIVWNRNVEKKRNYINMDTSSPIVYIKTEYIYVYIGKDLVTRFGTSNYELDRSLPKGKN